MTDLEKLRARIVELEVALKEGLKTIEWFEGWLNKRDEPVRYDPIDLNRHPPRFTVNYSQKGVTEITDFMKAVLEDAPGKDN